MTTETYPGQGPLEGRTDVPAQTLKESIASVGAAGKDAAAATAEEISAARTLVAEKLRQTRSRLVEARAVVADKAKCTAQATDAYVKDHPWQVLGVAAAAGVLAGVLLSRR